MNKAKYWFDRAQKEHFAIGAFNAASIETLKAIVMAAQKMHSPVMVEASPGEVDYFGVKELVGVVRAMEQNYEVPVLLNLDHATEYDSCVAAIVAGFDYIHFDGGKLSFEENAGMAKTIVDDCHQRDILVEGEIDHIMGSSADHRGESGIKEQEPIRYTDPAKAKDFVHITGVDTFASFIGNVHGLYSAPKKIDLGLLAKIKGAVGETFLSLHGGSGIPDGDIQKAVPLGIVKVNVNSEIRVAFRDKLKEILDRPEENEVAIYKLMPEAISLMQSIVEKKIQLFGSAGKLG